MQTNSSLRFTEIVTNHEAGAPLPDALRGRMEALFNADFRAVRLHVDSRIVEHGALALAHGDNVFLPERLADPDAPGFETLLAHELTHVLQQREGRIVGGRPATAMIDDDALEDEADRMALTQQVVMRAGLDGMRNRIDRAPASTPTPAVQCVLLHGRDATRKVDWLSGKNKLQDDQVASAKSIISGIADKGISTLTVTGLNSKKFGHESTGQSDANPARKSVTVWWKQAFGNPLKGAYGARTPNNIDDAIGICGLGTHIPEYSGKPAYRLHWLVDSGLAARFYLNNNTVTRMPSPDD